MKRFIGTSVCVMYAALSVMAVEFGYDAAKSLIGKIRRDIKSLKSEKKNVEVASIATFLFASPRP